MIPGSADITIYQGDTFTYSFRLKDSGTGQYIDLTGCTPRSQIRVKESATTTQAEFTAALLDQTTTPGGVRLSLNATQTAAITAGTSVWDVQITDSTGNVATYLKGKVTTLPEVTR